MNCCSKGGIHEHSPNRQIHIQIFHGIAWLFSIDLPDHGEDGFHAVRCVRRYLKVVVPCRFCILMTFPVNWRTGSVCKVFLPCFILFGNKFTFLVPGSSRRIVWVFWIIFFLMFHRCFSVNPPKCASTSRTWEVDAASKELGFILSGFPQSYRHPRTFGCNRIRCGGGTCPNERRKIHHWWLLNPLRVCGAASQAEILGTASGAEMADMKQMKKIVPLITSEIPSSQNICELVCSVIVTDLNLWVQEMSGRTRVQAALKPFLLSSLPRNWSKLELTSAR